MAKREYEVDRYKLERALRKAEENGPLTMDALWKAAESIYNADNPPRAITFSVIALRAKAWNLELKTKPGKRGRRSMTEEQKAAMQAGRGTRIPRAEKFKKFAKEFELQRAAMPESKKNLIDRAQQGSVMAAIAAHCYNCAGQSNKEVRLCQVSDCNLYHLRPGAMPFSVTRKLSEEEEKKEAA